MMIGLLDLRAKLNAVAKRDECDDAVYFYAGWMPAVTNCRPGLLRKKDCRKDNFFLDNWSTYNFIWAIDFF